MLAAAVGLSSPAFQTLVLPLGVATIVLGGFASARHARGERVAHGVAVGGMASLMSFSRFAVNSLWPPTEAAAIHPLWWEVLGWTSAPVAGLLGGWIAQAVARGSRTQRAPRPGEAGWGLWLPVLLAVIAFFAFAEQL
jgi:hypothetical protein